MTVPPRFAGLDIVRGAVMVLMAIDHVRVYAGLPAGGPTPGIFFTRWVTHFCAPVFAFLAGTSAFLHGLKLANKSALARYLASRGFLLVLLELTVIRAAWTFSVDYSQFLLAGVIWMLGWCMVLLATLLWLPTWAIATIGLLVIVAQDLFAQFARLLPASWHPIWEFIYPIGAEVTLGAGGPHVQVLYSLVPWIGVMATGYAFGVIAAREPAARNRLCLRIGLTATALFIVIAGVTLLLQPVREDAPPALFQFLNQRKYPASVAFLLMTLGPAIALLPLADRARGWCATLLATFGRVPMFYYLLHIPVIHTVALLVWLVRDGSMHGEWFATAPYVGVPPEQRWGLWLLYVVFVIVIALLYVPCRWYAGVKTQNKSSWLRYL
jgi:uncharacterized membrane protein